MLKIKNLNVKNWILTPKFWYRNFLCARSNGSVLNFMFLYHYKLQTKIHLTAARVSLTMLLTEFLTWWSGVDVIIGSIPSKLPFRGRRVGFLIRHPAAPPLKWSTFSLQVWVKTAIITPWTAAATNDWCVSWFALLQYLISKSLMKCHSVAN